MSDEIPKPRLIHLTPGNTQADKTMNLQLKDLIDRTSDVIEANKTKQPASAALTALAALATLGMMVRTAAATFVTRTLTGTAGEVTVTDGDGVAGNPTVTLPALINGNKKIGTADNNLEVKADGTVKLNGTATTWLDENFAGVALGRGTTPPDMIAMDGGDIYVMAFNGGLTMEQLFFASEINHNYKEGSDIVFHIHWSPSTTDAGNVKWQLAYKWVNPGGSFAGAETVITVTQAAGGVAWKSNKAVFPTVSGAGKLIGSQIVGRLFRVPTDDADTYENDAAITGTFGYHYEVNDLGSSQETVK